VLELLGRAPAAAQRSAQAVMEFETALAAASRKLEDRRDPEREYNPHRTAALRERLTPSIDWPRQLATWGIQPETVIVGEPEFFSAMDAQLGRTPIEVLKDYLRLRLVDEYADSLSPEFEDESFRFKKQLLGGAKEPKPRWKRVLEAQNGAIGMMLGRAYVRERFSERAKRRYAAMFEALREAYAHRIRTLDWMSEATKARALRKLATMSHKIGYPEHWKDDSMLPIGRDSFCANMLRAARWRFDDEIRKTGQPVDRSEWHMTPQTYNAYYSATSNEIVLPAAIFVVPGVPDEQLDDALAYGYVGASTIGHEITHGFDDEGRKFDEHGNLADWWTAQDATRFEQRAQVLIEQFDAFEGLPGLRVNGKASLGENIADLGGLVIALDAYRKTEEYQRGVPIAGLTPQQRYFLGYALGYLEQQRAERLRTLLVSDAHAPAKWRVNGALANLPEFHQAFKVAPGAPMHRAAESRAAIW
jgi:putative endopeptidase